MVSLKKQNMKCSKFKIKRIIISMIVPGLFGIGLYSWLSGFYSEPLFWLSIIFALPKLYVYLLLLPSLIYFITMEYLGQKLLQQARVHEKLVLKSYLFISTGTLIGGLFGLILIANSMISSSMKR